MTEDEAKTKWCPFARVGGENRWRQSLPEDEPWALNPVGCRCIASACMAWRWEPYPSDQPLSQGGHCGLAGKP